EVLDRRRGQAHDLPVVVPELLHLTEAEAQVDHRRDARAPHPEVGGLRRRGMGLELVRVGPGHDVTEDVDLLHRTWIMAACGTGGCRRPPAGKTYADRDAVKAAIFSSVPYLGPAAQGTWPVPPRPYAAELAMRSLEAALDQFQLADEVGFDWVT